MPDWMRRRNGWKSAAMTSVEITTAAGDCCPLARVNSVCNVTTLPK